MCRGKETPWLNPEDRINLAKDTDLVPRLKAEHAGLMKAGLIDNRSDFHDSGTYVRFSVVRSLIPVLPEMASGCRRLLKDLEQEALLLVGQVYKLEGVEMLLRMFEGSIGDAEGDKKSLLAVPIECRRLVSPETYRDDPEFWKVENLVRAWNKALKIPRHDLVDGWILSEHEPALGPTVRCADCGKDVKVSDSWVTCPDKRRVCLQCHLRLKEKEAEGG